MTPKTLGEWCIAYDAVLSYHNALVVSNNGYEARSGHRSAWMTYLESQARRELQEIEAYNPMSRVMYDSTTPENIPGDAQIVAYYPHAWGTDLSKHPHALIVRIDNTGAHADDCHILDVEAGAATNVVAHEWVMSWHKLHPQGMDAVNGWIRKPVLYVSTGALTGLRTACAGLDYDVWAAQWDGSQSPIAGCFARQYVDRGPGGENYDMSLVFDDTWGVKPVAPPAPPPTHPPIPGASLAALLVWGVGPDICSWRQVHSTDGGKTWV